MSDLVLSKSLDYTPFACYVSDIQLVNWKVKRQAVR